MSEQSQDTPNNVPDGEATASQEPESAKTEPLITPVREDGPNGATPSHEERLAALEKERDEYLDQWRRSAAEFQNFKKREERLRIERERNANTRLLNKLLPVLDDLRRGGQHVPEELASNEWVGGMLAIERKLWNVLESEGVSAIEAESGSDFDPTVHEAIVSLDHEEIAAGHIIQELERGYRRQDTVLRPARVSVAK